MENQLPININSNLNANSNSNSELPKNLTQDSANFKSNEINQNDNQNSKSLFNKICANSNVNAVYSGNVDLDRVAAYMQKKSTPPSLIEYTKDGKFYRVINRSWDV